MLTYCADERIELAVSGQFSRFRKTPLTAFL